MADPRAADVDVDVRIVDLHAGERTVRRAETTLTSQELARARRGVPAVHRRRVLLRAALRSALADETGIDPASVPLATTPAGRPYLVVQGGPVPVDVSCSASGGLGVVVLSRGRRVGVDVQRIEPWHADVFDEGWLTPREQQALTGLPLAERPAAVTRAWTQKEAVLKARGTGLTGPPADPETVIGRCAGTVAGWQLSDLQVPPGWVASLALEHRPVPAPAPHEETR